VAGRPSTARVNPDTVIAMTLSPPRAHAAPAVPAPIEPSGPAGRKVRLRPIRAGDRGTLVGFDRDSERHQPGRVGGYRHWAGHRAGAADSAADDFRFAIETLHGGMLVGSICAQADPESGRFSYGVGIGSRHRRCGYAADAVETLLAYLFGERGFRWCEVGIHGGNVASLTLHSRLGFREVDRLRDAELVREGAASLVLMSITARQFALARPARAGAVPPSEPGRGRHWRPGRGRHWPAGRAR
jgi:RimJ/RimL family protein N-acetyltransferase